MKNYLLIIGIGVATMAHGFGQTVWNYNFGTGTGNFTSGASTSFVPTPLPNGGTARVRVGTGGGNLTLENPGTGIGSGSELNIVAPTNTSANKFAIYDYNSAATTFSISFEVRFSGGSSGNFSFFVGDGSTYSNDATFSGTQVFTGIRFQYGASNEITANYRNSGSWTLLADTPFAQNTNYSVEIYGNNSAASQNYTRSDVNSLAANTWDMWINGTKAFTGLAKAQLANNSNIDSFMFYGETSTGNVANLTIDSIRYANGLTAIPEPATWALLTVGGMALLIRRKLRRKL